MSKKTAVIILVVGLVIVIVAAGYLSKQSNPLISPGLGKQVNQPIQQPPVSSYNVPKEIKYDSSTDLKEELDSINPQLDDSDFKE